MRTHETEYKRLEEAVEHYKRENALLRQDKERLDWLIGDDLIYSNHHKVAVGSRTAANLNEAYFRNLAAYMFWLMRREEKYSFSYKLFKGYFESYRAMSSNCCAVTLRTLKRSMSSNASPTDIDEAMGGAG